MFITRANRCRTVEIAFKNEKAAKSHATKNIVSDKGNLCSMYIGWKIVRVMVGAIHPAEWVFASRWMTYKCILKI